jgi:hypothetical protein
MCIRVCVCVCVCMCVLCTGIEGAYTLDCFSDDTLKLEKVRERQASFHDTLKLEKVS